MREANSSQPQRLLVCLLNTLRTLASYIIHRSGSSGRNGERRLATSSGDDSA